MSKRSSHLFPELALSEGMFAGDFPHPSSHSSVWANLGLPHPAQTEPVWARGWGRNQDRGASGRELGVWGKGAQVTAPYSSQLLNPRYFLSALTPMERLRKKSRKRARVYSLRSWERPLSHQGLVPCVTSAPPYGKITGRWGGEELEVNCSLSLSSRVAKRLLGSPDTAELPSQLRRITYQEHAVLEHRPAGFPV